MLPKFQFGFQGFVADPIRNYQVVTVPYFASLLCKLLRCYDLLSSDGCDFGVFVSRMQLILSVAQLLFPSPPVSDTVCELFLSKVRCCNKSKLHPTMSLS